jgi:hypothetical protein
MIRLFSSATLVFAVLIFLAAQARPALAYDGCLGVQAAACLGAIKPYLSELDYRSALRSLDTYLAGDIAGKRKPKGTVIVSYISKFAEPTDIPQILAIGYSSSLAVEQLEISLRPGANNAETEGEYQA